MTAATKSIDGGTLPRLLNHKGVEQQLLSRTHEHTLLEARRGDQSVDADLWGRRKMLGRGGGMMSFEGSGQPLRLEMEHFIDCVNSRATPRSDGRNGLEVIRVLEKIS